MSRFKGALLGGAALSMLAGSQAWAQQATAGDQARTISEVVVTAQKREERLQDVPVAISVVGQQQLQQQQITRVEDLVRSVPALTTYGQPGNPDTRYAIRGITTQSFSITSEQAVSFVLDGVVLGRTPTSGLFDVARIEVLRGPQGTLFGKNASGGVVHIVTNEPKLNTFEAVAHVDFGDKYSMRNTNLVLNAPLGDTAAVRLTLGESSTKGFLHNQVRNEDSKRWLNNARLRLRWEPTENLSINLIADNERQKTTEQVYIQFDQYRSLATGAQVPIPGCGPNAVVTPNSRFSCGADPSFFTGHDYGVSGQVDWRIGDYTLTSISSYRRYLQDGRLDVDGLPVFAFANGNIFNNKVATQELRIASPAGQQLEYVAGIYLSNTKVYNHLTQIIGPAFGLAPVMTPFNNPNDAKSETKNYALFGQATFHATDALSLIGGVRLTKDDVRLDQQSFASIGVLIPRLVALGTPITTTDKRENFSWRLAAQYEFDDSLMVYASAARGYKGPQIQFNPPNALSLLAGVPPTMLTGSASVIKPEIPMAYEAGFKTTLMGGLFAVNGDIFYTKMKDFQTSAFDPVTAASRAQNVPYAETKGFELDVFGRPHRDLTVNGGLIYNDATYGPFLTACTPVVMPNCPASRVVNVDGEQLQATPKWKLTFATEYTRDLPGDFQGFASADVIYTTKINFNQFPDPSQEVGAQAIVGARLGVRSADRKWSAAIFARNLFDERTPVFLFSPYLISGTTSPGIQAVGRSYSTESFRLLGVSLDARF